MTELVVGNHYESSSKSSNNVGQSQSQSQIQVTSEAQVQRIRRYQNVKAQRKCIDIVCQPASFFLTLTILITAGASALLALSLTSRYWEIMVFDKEKVNKIIFENNTDWSVSWYFEEKVARVGRASNLDSNKSDFFYLLPLHSGLWISCLDLTEEEYSELTLLGYVGVHCVDHLETSSKQEIVGIGKVASWQHRMQNLAIACAIVSLILLGAAVIVGIFGLLRCQISAVLVTGVIYVLAATFALFTLSIVHLKHKHRSEKDLLEIWKSLISLDLNEQRDFSSARLIYNGWSLSHAWIGFFITVLASLKWILLSKMMRYNPFSLAT